MFTVINDHDMNKPKAKPKARHSRVRQFLRSPLWAPLNQRAAWDRLTTAVNPLWSLMEARARVIRIVDEAPNVKSLWLKPNARFKGFQPGQHVLLELEINGARHARCFSFSSAPRADGLIRLTIKQKANGQVSAAAHALKAGQIVRLSQAQGVFAPQGTSQKLLLLSAGSGVTPMLSLLQQLANEKSGRDVVVVHCGHARNEIIFAEELRQLAVQYPQLRIARLDQDTARGKHALEKLLSDFAEGAIDVLVGTQMVTKGLDMERVTLVGVLSADQLLRYPEFRAHERAFQLMAQVAGRSGRRTDPGEVLVQAFDVAHPVLEFVRTHDVDGFFKRELEHRRAHYYPPFSRLVRFTLKHRDEQRVAEAAQALVDRLRPTFDDRVLGPEVPGVAWVRDLHIRNVLVKLGRGQHTMEKEAVRTAFEELRDSVAHGRVRMIADVDPI